MRDTEEIMRKTKKVCNLVDEVYRMRDDVMFTLAEADRINADEDAVSKYKYAKTVLDHLINVYER